MRALTPVAVAALLALAAGCGGGDGGGDPDGGPAPADAGDLADAEATTCDVDDDCDDRNPCTDDTCEGGMCEHTPHREGELCNDGLACTDPDICRSGECVGEERDCSSLSDFCNQGVCDEDAGGCVAEPRPDGTSCDDGMFCTEGDECEGGTCGGEPRDCSEVEDACNDSMCDEAGAACVPVPVANDTACDDGVFCTATDTCQDGTCTGSGEPGCDDMDACTADSCDADADACVHEPIDPIPGAEGPSGDATCSDGEDNDCDGAVDLDDTDCVDCTADGDCDDGNPCTDDACDGGACQNAPLSGTSCEDGDFCTGGDTCQDGVCEPGNALDCSDGDACTVDLCNESQDVCEHPTRSADPDSLVATTSGDGTPLTACLAAGSSARVLVWTDLVDAAGVPLSGATVTIGGVAAVESADMPGTYYAEIFADEAPSSESLEVVATACGSTVTLNSTVELTHAAANGTDGGTGGCAPPNGNLRVRVIEAETGSPIAGADVLVGLSAGTPFEQDPDALFGGASSSGSNVASTDSEGYAEFYDYGGALSGPVTVTAGATGRAYFTIADGEASDVVLALPELHPDPVPTSRYDMGTADATVENCADVDMALLLPKRRLGFFSDLDVGAFFEKSRCWDPENNQVDPTAVPENLWIPQQETGTSFCFLAPEFAEAPWALDLPDTSATGETENVALNHVRVPADDLQNVLDGGGSFTEVLGLISYHSLGYMLDEDVPTSPTSGRSIDADNAYDNSFAVTYGGEPDETDVIGVTLLDYAGENGTGPLSLLGTEVHEYDESGSTVSIPNSPLTGNTAPSGVRRLASLSAMYIDPSQHGGIDADRHAGVSTVLLRDDGSGGAPFDADASDDSANISSFLDIAGTDYAAPDDFRWDNATRNGNAPLYSRHELAVRTQRYLPVLSCATENEIVSDRSVQWIVMRPFGVSCGDQECFTLPELPASFPRSASGVQKKSGFETYVGSGASCTNDNDCESGESCVDPDGTDGSAEQMCMGGSGTEQDPYFVQDYRWELHLFDLGLAAAGWSFHQFAFADHDLWVTHESSNRASID